MYDDLSVFSKIGFWLACISASIVIISGVFSVGKAYLVSREETVVEEVKQTQELVFVVRGTPTPTVATLGSEQQLVKEEPVDDEYTDTILVVNEYKVPFIIILLIIICTILVFYFIYTKRATQREKHTQEILSMDLDTFQKAEIEELKKKYK